MLRLERRLIGAGEAQLYVREWLPDNSEPSTSAEEHERAKLKAVVCLLHGMGEHGERFSHVAESLTSNGHAVIAIDQFGHGYSSGKRGHMLSIGATISNAALMIDDASKRHPGLPLFLYGHSKGGNIALNCALRLHPKLSGVILSSPWLRLAFQPTEAKLWLARRLASILPALQQSTGLKAEDLYRSGNPRAATIENDRLYHNKITLRTFLEIQRAGEWAIEHADEIDVPILLFHGTADKVTSYDASKELAERLGERCTWYSVEGGYHELHNDVDGERTIGQMMDWIEYRCQNR
ncbi:alpha/beta hydrolase [Paenibacillus harenae]|uniref:alpha/beta hydrolase n=1 Tax=Paenibacillus harenae TaxID=306543 RepID=UPI00278E2293|nr:alpha/beta hydrolase [Paenibacillus harenae]MDQ0060451.1 alpha-beta hydrolase superfamily lysophospholipase [Paenibacillus harenae]